MFMLMWKTRFTTNITFLFTNNYWSHQEFVKYFVKRFMSLALLFEKNKILIIFLMFMLMWQIRLTTNIIFLFTNNQWPY